MCDPERVISVIRNSAAIIRNVFSKKEDDAAFEWISPIKEQETLSAANMKSSQAA